MASKRRRSDGSDVQPRCDVLRPKAVSESNDSKIEEATNVGHKSKLERYNRPIIERGHIYDGRLEEEQIRILVLCPGSGSDKIQCELRKPSPRKESNYEALSYHWGDQNKIGWILLQDVDFAVTQNLAEALQYLRYPHAERSLWVDAICLNQYDQEEKDVQLESMHLIYELAKGTIAWLGPPNDASDRAFSEMERLQNASVPIWAPIISIAGVGSVEEPSDDDDDWEDIKTFYDDDPFGELMIRDYWSRAWIVQEIMCASDLVIQCGSRVKPYKMVEDQFLSRRSASIEINTANTETGHIRFYSEAEVRIVRRESKMLSSKHYLDCFLDRECGLRHDNIYAFLHLLCKDIRQRKPNYKVDIRKLVLEITLEIIESTQSLHIIIIKGRQKPPRALEEAWQRDMPSWCPYLATPYRCCPIKVKDGPNLFAEKPVFSIVKKRFKIKKYFVVEKRLQTRDVPVVRERLRVRGFVIGRVSRTISQRIPPEVRASIDWSPTDVEREFAHYKRCVALGLDSMPKDDLSGCMSLMATTRTLSVAGRDEPLDIWALLDSPASDLDRPDIHELRRMFKNRISRSVCSFDLSRTVQEALESSESAPYMEINRIALVPRTAREGDEICVILGCSTPVVLRRIRKHYVVLGEAYIDTFTMGEFNVSVKLRDFVLGGNSFDKSEQFVWERRFARGRD